MGYRKHPETSIAWPDGQARAWPTGSLALADALTARIATHPAHRTPALELEDVATLRTVAGQPFGAGEFRFDRRPGRRRVHEFLQRLADRVGTRQYLVAPVPRRIRTPHAAQLTRHRARVDTRSQRKRHQPADGFGLRSRTTARFSDRRKQLEGTVRRFIGGDVQVATTGFHAGGTPRNALRPRAGCALLSGGGFRSAGAQHLQVAAPVAVDRHSLAPELKREPEGLLDVLTRSFVRKIDRLGNRVLGMFLEGGLDADVRFR